MQEFWSCQKLSLVIKIASQGHIRITAVALPDVGSVSAQFVQIFSKFRLLVCSKMGKTMKINITIITNV